MEKSFKSLKKSTYVDERTERPSYSFMENMTYLYGKDDKKDPEAMEVGMIANRHDMNVGEYIYVREIERPFDYDWLLDEARDAMIPIMSYMRRHGKKKIVLYCSGLQPALISIQKVCFENGIELDYMHWDRDKGYTFQKGIWTADELAVLNKLKKLTA